MSGMNFGEFDRTVLGVKDEEIFRRDRFRKFFQIFAIINKSGPL